MLDLHSSRCGHSSLTLAEGKNKGIRCETNLLQSLDNHFFGEACFAILIQVRTIFSRQEKSKLGHHGRSEHLGDGFSTRFIQVLWALFSSFKKEYLNKLMVVMLIIYS